MVCHQLDSRGWTMSWNDRGVRASCTAIIT
jgi:hypothetical protein